MELDALDGQGAVAQSHDHTVRRGGADLELVGHRGRAHHEGVVARRHERVGQTGKETLAVVMDLRGLAVHEVGCLDDLATVGLPDALVAQAHPEERNLAAELANGIEAHAAVLGPSRPR